VARVSSTMTAAGCSTAHAVSDGLPAHSSGATGGLRRAFDAATPSTQAQPGRVAVSGATRATKALGENELLAMERLQGGSSEAEPALGHCGGALGLGKGLLRRSGKSWRGTRGGGTAPAGWEAGENAGGEDSDHGSFAITLCYDICIICHCLSPFYVCFTSKQYVHSVCVYNLAFVRACACMCMFCVSYATFLARRHVFLTES
jgi:hypothetical protein